ncbi:MAG: hypothetical protein LW822_01425 [Phycisphaeraceae bacterium]|jgi:hypothetical protein|nr:hypothetical protein [Phycisphaeraceae bacterium]
MQRNQLITRASICALGLALLWTAYRATLASSAPAYAGPTTYPELIGKTVIVQFRRDALGIAGEQITGWSEVRNGAIGVQGDVLAFNDNWIVIRGLDSIGEKRDIWVPNHAVLNIISR